MTTFANALEGVAAVNASVGDRELVGLLVRHGQEEGKILARYRRFATDAQSPGIRYLVDLIIADEERHHRLMAELASAVGWGWSVRSPEPAVPEVVTSSTEDPALRAETRELLVAERQDHRELKKLRKQFAPYSKTTSWGLIIDMMLLDTKKHIRILEFIHKHCATERSFAS